MTQYETSKGPEREEAVDMSKEDLKSGSGPPQMTKNMTHRTTTSITMTNVPRRPSHTYLFAVAFTSSPPTSIIYRRAGTWTLHYLAFPDSVSLSTVINLWPHCLPASSIQYQVDFLARNIIQPSQSNGRGSAVIIAVHIAHTTTLAKYPFIQLTAHFCDEIVT